MVNNISKENEIQRENVMNTLKVFLKNTEKNFQVYYDELEKIVEVHIMKDEIENLSKNLQQHLMFAFNIEGVRLLQYLIFPSCFKIEELDLDHGEYRKRLEFINKIKIKYGSIILQSNNIAQMPFLINQVETSVSNNDSIHSITISRVDGKNLRGVFKSNSLMSIITLLTGSLEMSMKNGIFSLDENTVKNYINQSNQFNDYLQGLIKSQEQKQ